MSIVSEAAGVNCVYGGNKITSGLDNNPTNGALDPAEVSGTSYTCNGAPGATGAQGPAGPGVTWVDVTTTTQLAAPNTGYSADNAAQVTITLPSTADLHLDDVIQVSGIGAGGWKIAANTNQWIVTKNISAIPLAVTISGLQYDSIALQYIGNNTFTVLNYLGTNPTTLVTLPAGYVSQGGLTWMPVSSTRLLSWSEANTFCTTTILTGSRLPTKTELYALYTSGAMIGQGWMLAHTWSSTPYGPYSHYTVDLNVGVPGPGDDTTSYYVTCVR
jgi:hypothetical protein